MNYIWRIFLLIRDSMNETIFQAYQAGIYKEECKGREKNIKDKEYMDLPIKQLLDLEQKQFFSLWSNIPKKYSSYFHCIEALWTYYDPRMHGYFLEDFLSFMKQQNSYQFNQLCYKQVNQIKQGIKRTSIIADWMLVDPIILCTEVFMEWFLNNGFSPIYNSIFISSMLTQKMLLQQKDDEFRRSILPSGISCRFSINTVLLKNKMYAPYIAELCSVPELTIDGQPISDFITFPVYYEGFGIHYISVEAGLVLHDYTYPVKDNDGKILNPLKDTFLLPNLIHLNDILKKPDFIQQDSLIQKTNDRFLFSLEDKHLLIAAYYHAKDMNKYDQNNNKRDVCIQLSNDLTYKINSNGMVQELNHLSNNNVSNFDKSESAHEKLLQFISKHEQFKKDTLCKLRDIKERRGYMEQHGAFKKKLIIDYITRYPMIEIKSILNNEVIVKKDFPFLELNDQVQNFKKECSHCSKLEIECYCNICFAYAYCSSDCQREHYYKHRFACEKVNKIKHLL